MGQECSTLRNAAQKPRGDNTGDPNNAILRCGEGTPSSSIMPDTYPGSSPDASLHPSKDQDANRDLTMRQMADVIESVEARIKQIQVKRNPQVHSNPITALCVKMSHFVGLKSILADKAS